MKPKICFVSGDIGRSGGTERVCTIIANELSKRGYDVNILSFWKGNAPFFSTEKNINVYYLIDGKVEAWMKKTYIYAIQKLKYFIKKNQIDILIDVDTVLSRYSAYAIQGTSCRLISWEHFNYLHTIEDKQRYRALKLANKYATKILVLTKEDQKMHIELGNIIEDKVAQIYNPTPFNIHSTYESSTNTFLAVGRLTYQKGFERLLQAWKLVSSEVLDWNLQIVGSGEDREALIQLSKDLNLKRIEIIPTTNEIEYFYSKASIFVMSSRFEGFPMVLLEAKSTGLPIISYDCKTGPNEIVKDSRSGFIVEEGNIDELANKMIILAKDSEMRKTFSNEAIKEISEYTVEVIVNKWEELLSDVMTVG